MKKIISVFCAAVIMLSCFCMPAYALTANEGQAALDSAFNAMFATVAGDVNKDGSFNAADARAALLASAGLVDDVDMDAGDIDGDTVVTAIDARMLLRISAQLESHDLLYSAKDKLDLFNAFANNIKASGQKFKYTSTLKNVDMTYDNQKVIDKFNKQMNSIPGVEEKIDLGAELVKEKGNVRYNRNTGLRVATNLNYPVSEKDFVSILTLNDISAVDYKTNQSYTYAPKRTIGDTVQEDAKYEMTGLDALTVYFASEALTNVPADTTVLRHGKAFDVPQKSTLTSGYDQINNMFAGLEDIIGTMSASFVNLKYHDSSITIYFDKATKKICAMEYNLYYDFTVKLDMDLYFFPFINIDDALNITDKEFSQFVYCFQENYNSLGR